MPENPLADKVALITGGARRLGAAACRSLHAEGMRVVIHFRDSETPARRLEDELNDRRADSAYALRAELCDTAALPEIVERAAGAFGRLDLLLNNASGFQSTPFGQVTESQWDQLLAANLKAPFFLAQAAAAHLRRTRGAIVNIADIYGERPLKNHSVYCITKAGMIMLTRALARELAPEVRVNAVAPGAILWPEDRTDETARTRVLARIPLGRTGEPEDIARAVLFFLRDAPYVTGQVLAVCGGRSITL